MGQLAKDFRQGFPVAKGLSLSLRIFATCVPLLRNLQKTRWVTRFTVRTDSFRLLNAKDFLELLLFIQTIDEFSNKEPANEES
jgi:hypothetical protein